jgi:cell division protein FtsB
MKILVAILVILLILMQYRLWIGDGSVRTAIQLKQQIAAQQAQNKKLQEQNQMLLAEVQDLKGGKQAVEERARNDLGMVKKDETFYQIVK